ncbi:MAG: hypothetical protein ACXIT9_05745 [Nitritalea sp.]
MLNWREINSELPEIGQIVILSNEKITDSRKWTLGQFLESDDKTTYGFLIQSNKIVKPETFDFWKPFLIKDLGVPGDYKDEELPQFLSAFKNILKSYVQRFLLMFHVSQFSGKGLFHLDYYLNGAYSRALSLIEGFLVLMDSRNYLAASHLVRPYLDTFLRLYAAWLVEDPHDFANQVMKGKKVEEFFDKENPKQGLKDWYLRNKASEEFPWVKEIYNNTSGYIHFSSKHIFNPIVDVDLENSTVGTYLSKYDSKTVTDLHRIEAILVMIEISNCILEYAYGWARTKME